MNDSVDATFIMIKQGLHDERLTRSSSGFRAEEAVSGRVLGLLKTFSITFGETNELKRVGEAPICKLKRSSICLTIFSIRG